jgi:hypothetical protein
LAHARDLLGESVADRWNDAAPLPIEVETEPRTVHRRVRQAARHLARRGEFDDARRLAIASGLA